MTILFFSSDLQSKIILKRSLLIFWNICLFFKLINLLSIFTSCTEIYTGKTTFNLHGLYVFWRQYITPDAWWEPEFPSSTCNWGLILSFFLLIYWLIGHTTLDCLDYKIDWASRSQKIPQVKRKRKVQKPEKH